MNRSHSATLALLLSVFFLWGFLTALNSVLIPHLQQAFQLSYSESMWIQVVFSSCPLLISLPTARLIGRVGYGNALLLGTGLVTVGALMFYPATARFSFPLVLLAVMVTALGVASLQVVGNPYVARLGGEDGGPQRLTIASSANSLGTTLAPYIGAALLFSQTTDSPEASAALVQLPYMLVAAAVAVLTLLIKMTPMPEPAAPDRSTNSSSLPAWRYRHLVLGVVAVFCYVGAEIATGSFLVSYLSAPDLGGFDRATAGRMLALYWGGAMVGRLTGSLLFRFVNARKVLIFNATVASVLVWHSITEPGRTGAWALVAVGLCNSIMYPVIFSLAINKLGDSAPQGSGLLIMAGSGGAVIPMLQAIIADSSGLSVSFCLPGLCYLVILAYGLFGWKPAGTAWKVKRELQTK